MTPNEVHRKRSAALAISVSHSIELMMAGLNRSVSVSGVVPGWMVDSVGRIVTEAVRLREAARKAEESKA